MHRIDSVTATPDNRFTEGNPTIPLPPTMVSADWLNSVQEELVATIVQAGLALHRDNNTQLLQAIRNLGGEAVWSNKQDYTAPALKFGANGKLYVALLSSGPKVANIGPKDPTVAANAAFWLDYAASITPPPATPYELCTTVYSRLCVVSRPGFVPVNGTLVANAVNLYPEAWGYLQTVEGQQMCVTESAWQALVRATWHTNADGTKIGWDGVGGAAKYVVDVNAGTIRVPDLRGMTDEVMGFDSLGVGGVRGDGTRKIVGANLGAFNNGHYGSGAIYITSSGTGQYTTQSSPNNYGERMFAIDSSRVVPTAAKNQIRAWVSDARVYLGVPLL